VETNLAVLIDFENIAAGTEKEGLGRFDVEALIQRVKDKGRILVARSYADWGRFSRFKQALLTSNVTMMELTSHGMQDKNRADIAMVVDALELAFTRSYVDTFVVVSGDSDFTPLVLKMRELNKRVIGIGTRKSTSRLLIQACDEFIFYDSVIQPKTAPKRRKITSTKNEVQTAFDVLEDAIDGLRRENPDPPLASVVKSAVLRKSPDFNESDLGFSSFARFLEAAVDAGVVRLTRDQKSGGYRVETGEESERQPTEEEPREDDGAGWSDEYMPAGTDVWVQALTEAGLPPVAAATRLAVLEALESVVSERTKKRRKTTAQFVKEDVKKKLRRTHPELPPDRIQSILDGLMRAGELLHRDGSAIRSGSAPFTLNKDAQGLNEALVRQYLAQLREAGCDLSDTSTLGDFLYGDPERRREVEETLAYLASDVIEPDSGPPADLDDLDLDDLLVPLDEGRRAPREPATPRRSARAPAREAEPTELSDLSDVDQLLVAEEPKPRKKRTRRKKSETEATPSAEASAEDATESTNHAEALDDLDALLEAL